MGDAAGKLSHRLHPRRLEEALLTDIPLSHVLQREEDMLGVAPGLRDASGVQSEGASTPALGIDRDLVTVEGSAGMTNVVQAFTQLRQVPLAAPVVEERDTVNVFGGRAERTVEGSIGR